MIKFTKTLAAVAAGTVLVTSAFALSAIEGPSTVVPIEHGPASELVVDSPLSGRLAGGAALLPYRAEDFRMLPLLGAAALDLSPRAGHLHVTVDDPWRWGEFSDGSRIGVVRLSPGEHDAQIELADLGHQSFGETVTITAPRRR